MHSPDNVVIVPICNTRRHFNELVPICAIRWQDETRSQFGPVTCIPNDIVPKNKVPHLRYDKNAITL